MSRDITHVAEDRDAHRAPADQSERGDYLDVPDFLVLLAGIAAVALAATGATSHAARLV